MIIGKDLVYPSYRHGAMFAFARWVVSVLVWAWHPAQPVPSAAPNSSRSIFVFFMGENR